jgi:hypothetical protein
MMLAGSAHEASSLFTTPADERWYEEFLVALRAGMFGKRRSTRVLLLNPYKPFSPWRLTTDDAERVIERCGYQSFTMPLTLGSRLIWRMAGSPHG